MPPASKIPSACYELDKKFMFLIEQMKTLSVEEIKNHMQSQLHKLHPGNIESLEQYFKKYPFWGSLDTANGNYELLYNRAAAFHDHWMDFSWLYGRLQDYRSKTVFYKILENWFSYTNLEPIREKAFCDYFDLDIMQCDENEVIVDLGAYIGDTVIHYINTYGLEQYRKFYCYEMTTSTFVTLQTNLRQYKNIDYRKKAVADKSGTLYITENSDVSANSISENGTIAIPTVTIDEDITEPVTLIKMDIEGAEQKALLGCKNHIIQDKPKLAISVYHNNEDLWKIARMVEDMCPGYRFYMRYHGGYLTPSEITLLGIYE